MQVVRMLRGQNLHCAIHISLHYTVCNVYSVYMPSSITTGGLFAEHYAPCRVLPGGLGADQGPGPGLQSGSGMHLFGRTPHHIESHQAMRHEA